MRAGVVSILRGLDEQRDSSSSRENAVEVEITRPANKTDAALLYCMLNGLNFNALYIIQSGPSFRLQNILFPSAKLESDRFGDRSPSHH